MSLFIFRLPDIGEGVAEAEIVAWHVEPGQQVAEDQSLVDVMTDKATVDMTSPVAGTVVAIHGAIGDLAAVGASLVEIQTTDQPQSVPEPSQSVTVPETAQPPAPADSPPMPAPPLASQVSPLATPATRRRAAELGISLQSVQATGPGGVITPEDLDRYMRDQPVAPGTASGEGITDVRIAGLRRTIAEHLQDSKRRIPHFTYVEEFDLTALEGLRAQLNSERSLDAPKLTLLPFFMRAVVQLRPEFPSVNARYDDDAGVLHMHEAVHIGIATQTHGGLMVPVVRHAEGLNLWDCARELNRVAAAARKGSATRDELSGSTITLTSLGPLGGIAATPIINAPEIAILGPNKMVDRPVVIDGQIVIRRMMNLSSSFDHRIIDGHDAARFVQRLRRLIEQPALLSLGAL